MLLGRAGRRAGQRLVGVFETKAFSNSQNLCFLGERGEMGWGVGRGQSKRFYALGEGLKPSGNLKPSKLVMELQDKKGEDLLSALDVFGSDSEKGKVLVEGYTNEGFLINNILSTGPQFLLPAMALHFNVPSHEAVTSTHLSLLTMIFPKIEVLIWGTGDDMKFPPTHLIHFLRERGISVEPMSTWHAVGTFNILNQENRRVAALLFPAKLQEERELPTIPDYKFSPGSEEEEPKVEVEGGEGLQR